MGENVEETFILNNELLTDCREQIQFYTAIKRKLGSSIKLYEMTIIFINMCQILLPVSITIFESLKQYMVTLSEVQINMIPIILSATLSLFISFSKYFQFENTLFTMGSINSKYTFIISRLKHKERCILNTKTNDPIVTQTVLLQFDRDTLDSYIEQILNETDVKFKNITIDDLNTHAILQRQYSNRISVNFTDFINRPRTAVNSNIFYRFYKYLFRT